MEGRALVPLFIEVCEPQHGGHFGDIALAAFLRELTKARSGGVNQFVGQISCEASQDLLRVSAFFQHFERFLELSLLQG